MTPRTLTAFFLIALIGGALAAERVQLIGQAEAKTPIVDESNPSIDDILVRINRLNPQQRMRLKESMSVLSVNCPYTRASLLLPIVINEVLDGIDIAQVDRKAKKEWTNLKKGLKVHLAVLDAIGVDLGEPGLGDYLYNAADHGSMIDRATLVASADPVSEILRLIEQNNPLVDALSQKRMELIRRQNDTAYYLMGQTTMFHQTVGWHTTLRRIAPFLSDPDTRKQIDRLIGVLDLHDLHGC